VNTADRLPSFPESLRDCWWFICGVTGHALFFPGEDEVILAVS
jgi:hypothetical protein